MGGKTLGHDGTLAAALAAMALVAACTVAPDTLTPPESTGAPGPARSSHVFELIEEDGVQVARTSGGPLFEGQLFAPELALTMHQDPSDEATILYRPRGVLSGAGGHFFVLDSGNSRIAVFDDEGEFVRAFGQSGQGPGEFSNMAVLQSLNDGVLSIFDLQQQRMTLFRTDGTVIDDFSHGGIPVSHVELGPDGQLIKIGGSFGEADPGVQARRVQVLSPDGGRVLAEMQTAMVKSTTVQVIEVSEGNSVSRSMAVPYAARPSAVHVPGRGFLLSAGDEPELTWYDYDGRRTGIIRIELAARPVTQVMRRRYEENRRRTLREAAERDGRDSPEVPDIEFPDEIGYWQQVIVDDRGYVWLEDVLASTEREDAAPWTFLVLDPEGRYLGQARLPMARPTISGGNAMGMVANPDSGEVEVRVYRLRPLPEGFEYASAPGS